MNAPPSANYVAEVLLRFVQLPETPLRAGAQDQERARRWRQLGDCYFGQTSRPANPSWGLPGFCSG